jgi:hypothetical protein
MELFQNLALGKFTRSIGLPAVVTAATVKARDTVPLDAKFHDGLALSDMGEDLMLVFVIKDGFADDSETLALASAWTEIAAGHYRANLSLNTAELIAAVGTAGSIKVFGELSWSRDAGDTWASSPTLAITVENDVYKGTEGTPLELDGPIDWLGQRVMIRTTAEGSPVTAVSGMQVEIEGPHAAMSGFYAETGTNGGFPLYLSGGNALFVPDADDQPDMEFSKWVFADVWPGPVLADIQVSNNTDGAEDTPDLVPGWYDIGDPFGASDTTVTAGNGPVPGEFLGQYCRVGDESPYDWHRWDGTTWIHIPMFLDPSAAPAVHGGGIAVIGGAMELVLWNSTQEAYQILRLSGGAGAETIEISNIP